MLAEEIINRLILARDMGLISDLDAKTKYYEYINKGEIIVQARLGSNQRNCRHCKKIIEKRNKKCPYCKDWTTDDNQYKYESAYISQNNRQTNIVEMIEGGNTLQEVGTKLNLSRERVRQIYKRQTGHGTQSFRDIQNERLKIEKICEYCSSIFRTKLDSQTYCSYICRNEAAFYRHNALKICKTCNLGYLTPAKRPATYCSQQCYGRYIGKTFGIKQKYSDEYLINLLRDWTIKNKRIPSTWDVIKDSGSMPNYMTFRKRFGTWEDVMKIAGLEQLLQEIKTPMVAEAE